MNYYLLVYKGNTSITSGEDLGSEYNLGIGCPVCGTGAKLMSNLYINEMQSLISIFLEQWMGILLFQKNCI